MPTFLADEKISVVAPDIESARRILYGHGVYAMSLRMVGDGQPNLQRVPKLRRLPTEDDFRPRPRDWSATAFVRLNETPTGLDLEQDQGTDEHEQKESE